ncbi:MAG: hypothetical protein IJ557_02605 [Bacteroidaceae bacterium]|nr:hypothetical protein [Bacteroidaceae bacterium]
MNIIKSWIRKHEAKREGVPYEKRMWYNYQAMLPKDSLAEDSFIEIFDKNGRYITCPDIGGTVIYNNKGRRYKYQIIGFANENPLSDWLNDSDYIHPYVRYVEKCKD